MVPFGQPHWRAAADALRRFGEGRHPAALGPADSLAYAVAASAASPSSPPPPASPGPISTSPENAPPAAARRGALPAYGRTADHAPVPPDSKPSANSAFVPAVRLASEVLP